MNKQITIGKVPYTPEEAEKIILDSVGKMFDPLITDVFVEEREQFLNCIDNIFHAIKITFINILINKKIFLNCSKMFINKI